MNPKDLLKEFDKDFGIEASGDISVGMSPEKVKDKRPSNNKQVQFLIDGENLSGSHDDQKSPINHFFPPNILNPIPELNSANQVSSQDSSRQTSTDAANNMSLFSPIIERRSTQHNSSNNTTENISDDSIKLPKRYPPQHFSLSSLSFNSYENNGHSELPEEVPNLVGQIIGGNTSLNGGINAVGVGSNNSAQVHSNSFSGLDNNNMSNMNVDISIDQGQYSILAGNLDLDNNSGTTMRSNTSPRSRGNFTRFSENTQNILDTIQKLRTDRLRDAEMLKSLMTENARLQARLTLLQHTDIKIAELGSKVEQLLQDYLENEQVRVQQENIIIQLRQEIIILKSRTASNNASHPQKPHVHFP